MAETDDIEKIIAILRKVPEKKLLILELANSIPIKNGMLDPEALEDKQLEVTLAIAEAKSYGKHTTAAVTALVRERKEAKCGT